MSIFVRNCPVCGQQSSKILFHPKSSPGAIAQCTHCAMVYVETIEDPHALIFDGPVVYGEMDAGVINSSDLMDVKNSWELRDLCDKEAEWSSLRQNAKQALEKIDSCLHKQPGSRILDFGSGFGFFLSAAKEEGWETYGLEPLASTAVYARAVFGLNIITDTLHEDTFPENFFDVITAFQVFEHIPLPDATLKGLGKILKPGGLILIEVPRFDTWSMRLMRQHHRHFVQDHLNFYSYTTLQRQLTDNGFKVVASYRPKRVMTVNHLFTYWIAKKLPKPLLHFGKKLLILLGVWNRNIAVDVGDMLAIIGQRL